MQVVSAELTKRVVANSTTLYPALAFAFCNNSQSDDYDTIACPLIRAAQIGSITACKDIIPISSL
jgi:hypothetical protein